MGKLRPHLPAEGPTLRPLRVTSALLGAPYPGWPGRSTVPRSLWFLEALCFLEPLHPVASSGPGTQALRSVPPLSCENTAAATGGLLGCGSAGHHGAGTPVGRRVSWYRALAPSVPLGILITDRGALLSRWHGRVFKDPQHSGLLRPGAAPAQGRCLGMGRGWEGARSQQGSVSLWEMQERLPEERDGPCPGSGLAPPPPAPYRLFGPRGPGTLHRLKEKKDPVPRWLCKVPPPMGSQS